MATISASDNPDLANQLIAAAVAGDTTPSPVAVEIVSPPDCSVTLPGGYLSSTGEIVTVAEVRELNGRDEESFARIGAPGRKFLAILSRGVVKVGEQKANEQVLDGLLAGDRDYLMLAIYRATFGNEFEYYVWCPTCEAERTCILDVNSIPIKKLAHPEDRKFPVKGRKNTYTVLLPTGHVQREVLNNPDGTPAEWSTEVLFNTVVEVNGYPVINKEQIRNIGVADRRTLGEELNARAPGPQINDAKAVCQECAGDVPVEVNIGALFRF